MREALAQYRGQQLLLVGRVQRTSWSQWESENPKKIACIRNLMLPDGTYLADHCWITLPATIEFLSSGELISFRCKIASYFRRPNHRQKKGAIDYKPVKVGNVSVIR